jgi:hypothetical protein
MKVTKKIWFADIIRIIGFEGEGDGGAGGAGDGGAGSGDGGAGQGDGQGGAGGDSGDGQGSGDAGQGESGTGDDATALKTALDRERRDRKALDKELKALRAADKTRKDAELTEVERLQKQTETDSAKVTKLAQGFKDSAVKAAIIAAATDAKFRDPSDALRPEILSAVGVEQDEDDPTKVEVDTTGLKDLIKKLAKDKPHYVGVAGGGNQGGGNPSGSKFGGSGNKGNEGRREQIIDKYPALRARNARPMVQVGQQGQQTQQ